MAEDNRAEAGAQPEAQDTREDLDLGQDGAPEGGQAGADRIPDSLDALMGEDPQIEGSEEIEALRGENAELKDRYVRALAETENVRKRAQRDRAEAEQYGGSKLARDLLPVYDNLTRALDAAGEDADKGLVEGVELTLRELISVFGKHGIEPIVPAEGDRFDPAVHQAMFEAPVPGTKAGEIIQVAATGFMLRERLLRPAQVGVSSTPAS